MTIVIVASSLLVLLVISLVFFVRWISRSMKKVDENSPLEVARMRYARGEISRDELEQIKKDIEFPV